DLCPIKILATQFLYERGTSFDRVDLYRARLERQTHTILRELRKLREETGDEEDERDTGLGSTELAEVWPVQEEQESCDQRSVQSQATEHAPDFGELSRVEAGVTGEQRAGATEDVIRKTEPTVE